MSRPLHKRDVGHVGGARGTGDDRWPDGPCLVSARDIELKGPWGQVFGPLDLDIDVGGVIVLAAAPGAARTALMMALCGRMKLNGGKLRVLGHTDDPHAVFAESSICCFDELDDVQPSVTVQDLVTEQIRWGSHWYEWVPRASTRELEAMCGYLFADRPLPPIDAFVADLPELDQMLLRIGIANTRRPPLLVVGRLDRMADDEQRRALMQRLIELGKDQSVITADVNGDELEEAVDQVVRVPDLLEFQQRSAVARRVLEDTEQHPEHDHEAETESADRDDADRGPRE